MPHPTLHRLESRCVVMFIIHNEINLIFRINCQKIFYSLTFKHCHDSYFFTSIMAFYSNNRLLYSNVYSLYRREQLFDLYSVLLCGGAVARR